MRLNTWRYVPDDKTLQGVHHSVITIPEQIFQAAHGDPVVGQEQLTVLSQQLQRVIQEHIEGLCEILLLVRKVTCHRAQVE
jgi:hypothetical protein